MSRIRFPAAAKRSAQTAPANPAPTITKSASPKPRRARVLVIGPLPAQFQEIKARAEAADLPVELLYADKDKRHNGPLAADHIVPAALMPAGTDGEAAVHLIAAC